MRALARLHPGVSCADTDGTAAGIRYDAPPEGFVRPTQEEIDAALLALDQEARCDAVDALYREKLLTGFLYEGVRYELDDMSQTKISALAVGAGFYLLGVEAVTWSPIHFLARDRSVTTFETAAAYMAFANTAKVAAEALFTCRAILKATCRATASAEDLAAIDIAAGWPDV